MKELAKLVALMVATAWMTMGLWGCDRTEQKGEGDALLVVATSTMLEDLVAILGGDEIEVQGLLSTGADPHIYQPRPSDARLVSQSDAVVMNGLLLEGWMEGLVRHAGGERAIIVAGDAVDQDRLLRVEGAVDPHIWFDVAMWRQVAEHVCEALIELAGADQELAASIAQRQRQYDQVLAELHDWTQGQLNSIPEDRRVLITSHDAFNYFGQAYHMDVEAILGLSTEQEASQRDVANIIELVRARNAPAVFMESSVHPGLIQQVARETGVEAAGPLYSDSVGPVGSGAETYVGMVQANIRMITEALGGDYQAFDDRAVLKEDEPEEEEV